MTKKLTKRFVSFIITLAMVMTVMPIIPAMAAETATYTSGKSWADVTTDSGNYTQDENGNITLTGDVNISTFIELTSGSLTVDLGGHKLTRTGAGATVFSVKGGELTIKGTDEGSTVTNSNETATTGGMVIADGANAKINIEGGTFDQTIKGGVALASQNGASVKITGGTFTISNNETTTMPVLVNGGGSLDMSGGEIKAAKSCLQVQDENSKVTITNGKITSTAGDKTAAVYVTLKGSFEMSGGEITTAGQAINVGNAADEAEDASVGTNATIKGTAKISRTNDPGVGLLQVGDYGILNIEGEADIQDTVMAFANGELNISGGKITSTGYAVGTNGSDDGNPNSSKGAKINITGGTITGSDEACGIYAPAGDWTISGGTTKIKGGAGIVVRGADVDVQGGTITATGIGNIEVGDAKHQVPAAGITVDNAGYPEQSGDDGQKHVSIGEDATVTAPIGGKTLAACDNGTDVTTDGFDPDENPFNISGGNFTLGEEGTKDQEHVNQFLGTGYKYDTSGDIIYEGNAEAEINGRKFEKLADAIEYAQTDDVIKILAENDEVNGVVTLPGTNGTGRLEIKKKVTIDLNGKTLKKPDDWNDNVSSIVIVGGGDLTVKDSQGTGKITGNGTLLMVKDGTLTIDEGATIDQTAGTDTENDTAVAAYGDNAVLNIKDGTITAKESGVGVFGNGQLTITGGTITADEMGISTNGSLTDKDADIQIKGGTITSTGSAGVYLPAGKMTVTEGEITGKAGIVQFGGELTVEGGTIKATDTENDNITVGDSGQAVPVAAVTTNKQSGYADPTATLKGGKFEAAEGKDAVTYTENGGEPEGDSALTVEGGSYSAPVDEKLLSNTLNYEAKSNDADAPYSYHQTLDDAQDAAGSDGEVIISNTDSQAVKLNGDSKITEVKMTKDDDGNDVVDITVNVGIIGATEAGSTAGDAHKGDAAFWVGVGLIAPADADGVNYKLVGRDEDFRQNNGNGSFDTFAGGKGFAAWVNAASKSAATYVVQWTKAGGETEVVTYNITFTDVTLQEDNVTPNITAVGFKADAAAAKTAIDTDLGKALTANDVVGNTMYAVFKLEGAAVTNTSVTATFSDGTHTYTEPAFAVTDKNKHVVYFSFDDLGNKVTPDGTLGEGHYTITVTAGAFHATKELDVYKVVYKAENGTVTQPTKAIYAASVADADTLTATKPEVTPDSGYTAENVDWSEGKPSDTDHTITYTATCAEEYVPVVEAATIADSNGDVENVVGDYSAEYTEKDAATGHYKITGTAADLKKHTNGDDTEGYWFGVEIKAPTDVDTSADKEYKVTFDEDTTAHPSKFDDLVNIADAKGAILYFDTKGDGNDKHTVTIEWDDSTKFIYDIDLSEVKHYVENPTVNVGNDKGTMTPTDDYTIDPVTTYEDKTGYKFAKVTFKTTGDQIVPWGVNGANKEGNWVGITVAPPVGSKIIGLATAAEETPMPAFTAPNANDGDSDQLSGYYVDANNITTKPYFFVKIKDSVSGVETIYCYLLTKDASINLEQKPVTKYTVTCNTATNGKVVADKTDAAKDETVTLTVTAETGYKLDTLVVQDAANTEVTTAQQADGTYTFTMPASNVTVTATFAAETVEPDTAEIKFVGFVTADEIGNDILNALAPQVKGDGATWGSEGITDCIANTLYAAFSADNEEGVNYTVKFTKGEKSYEQTVEGVTKGGLAYVSFDDQAKDAFGAEPQGEYTVELFKNGTLVNASSDEIEVYQVKYVASEGVTGNDTVVYTDAEGLDAAKTARPEGFALASGMNRWNDNKAETSGYTVTVTLSGYHRSTSSGGSGGSSNHSVSAPSKSDNGSVSVSSKSAPKGSKVTITVKPDKGYKTGSVTVKDANGNILEVTDNGDGTYSFVMPDTKVSVATEFVEEGTATPAPDTTPSPEPTPAPDAEDNCPSEKFVDVDQSQWYHEGIDYALTNGLMSGMDDTTFEPDSTTTRAMIVAVLYRLDGSPEVAMANFTDVPENAWYANAVAWGEANGVVSGYDEETFGPEDSITREQMAAILYRYAQYEGIDVSAQADLSVYSDAGSVSDWANTSLSWANAEGLISGMSDTELAPTGTATRAQVAAILMRYCENIAK